MKDYFDNHLSKSEIMKKYNIASGTFDVWKTNYGNGCLETGKGKKGNLYVALYNSKHLTHEQRLTLENIKLKIENERLKKGYLIKGDGINKEYVSILNKNIKSSKN